MSTAIQLNFTLRTTPGVKTVHLLGSWDNYQNQLPMSQDPSKSNGGWKGTFRFQPGTVSQGARYWYYYIMDGYHVTHDPAISSVVEPTTQRKLNVLDIPGSKDSKRQSTTSSSGRSKRSSRRMSVDVAKGRSLSPSQIKSPKPYKPGQAKQIVNYENTHSVAALERQFASATISESSEEDDDSESDSESDSGSDVPSLTSRSSSSSSPSSLSSGSNSSSCSCERYGITRSGNRIKLDCGGKRCGYDNGSSCSSESEEEVYHAKATRRHGVVVRGR